MSKRKLVVPEAREALDQFKVEIAKEFGIGNGGPIESEYLASYHTGRITKELDEKVKEQLMLRKDL